MSSDNSKKPPPTPPGKKPPTPPGTDHRKGSRGLSDLQKNLFLALVYPFQPFPRDEKPPLKELLKGKENLFKGLKRTKLQSYYCYLKDLQQTDAEDVYRRIDIAKQWLEAVKQYKLKQETEATETEATETEATETEAEAASDSESVTTPPRRSRKRDPFPEKAPLTPPCRSRAYFYTPKQSMSSRRNHTKHVVDDDVDDDGDEGKF